MHFRSGESRVRIGIEKLLEPADDLRCVGDVGIHYEVIAGSASGGPQCDVMSASIPEVSVGEVVSDSRILVMAASQGCRRVVDDAQVNAQRDREELPDRMIHFLRIRLVRNDRTDYVVLTFGQ